MITLLPRLCRALVALLPVLILTGCDNAGDPGEDDPEDEFRVASRIGQVYDLPTETWRDSMTYTYLYDERGQLTELIAEDAAGNPSSTVFYTYNAAGLLVESRVTYSSGFPEQVAMYRYDGSERLVERRDNWLGGEDWDSFRLRTLYTYNAQDLLERVAGESRGDEGWELRDQWLYTYNADETLREVVQYYASGGNLELPYERWRYFYTAGQQARVERDLWDGESETWLLRGQTHYEHDGDGNLSRATSEQLQSGSFVPISRQLYTWERSDAGRPLPAPALRALEAALDPVAAPGNRRCGQGAPCLPFS